jgi:hypothetical protein
MTASGPADDHICRCENALCSMTAAMTTAQDVCSGKLNDEAYCAIQNRWPDKEAECAGNEVVPLGRKQQRHRPPFPMRAQAPMHARVREERASGRYGMSAETEVSARSGISAGFVTAHSFLLSVQHPQGG